MLKSRLLFSIFMLFGGYNLSIFTMDNPTIGSNQTYACDWCQNQQQCCLIRTQSHENVGVNCTHILCQQCFTEIIQHETELVQEPRVSWCNICRSFYHQKKKVCWFKNNGESLYENSNTPGSGLRFTYGGDARQLPSASTIRVFPVKSGIKLNAVFSKQLGIVCVVGAVTIWALYYLRSKMLAHEDTDDEGENQENDLTAEDQKDTHEIA